MSKWYELWVLIKYQFYKRIYWKFKKPEPTSKFYGWQEIGYDVLDQRAVGIGVVDPYCGKGEDYARIK